MVQIHCLCYIQTHTQTNIQKNIHIYVHTWMLCAWHMCELRAYTHIKRVFTTWREFACTITKCIYDAQSQSAYMHECILFWMTNCVFVIYECRAGQKKWNMILMRRISIKVRCVGVYIFNSVDIFGYTRTHVCTCCIHIQQCRYLWLHKNTCLNTRTNRKHTYTHTHSYTHTHA